jgi:tRNA A-37 threonylcarbamoyl transferase component Bud32
MPQDGPGKSDAVAEPTKELAESDVVQTGDDDGTRYVSSKRTVDEAGMAEPLPSPAPSGPIKLTPAGPDDGRYEDAGEIGRGGMGRVHNVRDTRLQRSVAMKALDPEMAKQRVFYERFIEEAQIQAQLEHPNIPPAHDIGIDRNGVPFFTMKLVHGISLSAWLRESARPPGSPERLGEGMDAFIKICDALAFAHAKGVLHRDLKPANIMLGAFGEVYVMDWGLAKTVTDSTVVVSNPTTAEEDQYVLGTPAYISPEAARREPCDERADIFGLGAILYVIVTGRTVYGTSNPLAALQAAWHGNTVPPEEAAPHITIPKRLSRILARALAPLREDRYPSVAALRADVQQFMRGGLNLPRQVFPEGTRIVVEGDAGNEAFIIVEGTCVAYKTIDGERRTLRSMGPGEVFGETAVLSDAPRTATVEAVDDVTAIVIDRHALEDGLGFDTWLGTMVKALATRFRELDARLAEVTKKG